MEIWYPSADRSQPGSNTGGYTGGPFKGVLHTTESTGWPAYSDGFHPHFTVRADSIAKVARVRQHFALNVPARALVDTSGNTLRTNRDSAIQIEIVGTCDPSKSTQSAWSSWYIHTFPDWFWDGLKALMRWIEAQTGIQRRAPQFLRYPRSYGATDVRFTAAQWDNFDGWCGHQHVPENLHGDPGDINIAMLLDSAAQPKEGFMALSDAEQVDLYERVKRLDVWRDFWFIPDTPGEEGPNSKGELAKRIRGIHGGVDELRGRPTPVVQEDLDAAIRSALMQAAPALAEALAPLLSPVTPEDLEDALQRVLPRVQVSIA